MKKETKKVAAKRIAKTEKTESNYGKLLAANKAYKVNVAQLQFVVDTINAFARKKDPEICAFFKAQGIDFMPAEKRNIKKEGKRYLTPEVVLAGWKTELVTIDENGNKVYNRRIKGELRPVTKWSAFVVMQCATRVWAALELQARKAARLAAKQQKDSAK